VGVLLGDADGDLLGTALGTLLGDADGYRVGILVGGEDG